MRISTDQLARQLERELASLYTVFGDEPLLTLEAADRIRARARQDGYTERDVLTAEQHFDWSRVRIAAQSDSLFATRRILELRIPNGKPGAEGAEALQQLIHRPPADVVTLIALPELDWRTQKSPWFEALDSAGTLVEAKRVGRNALPAWLAARFATQGQQADQDTLDFIADQVEGNLLAAFQEVQKLGLLLPSGKLSFEAVKQAVLDVARFEISELNDALVTGDARHYARVLDALKGEGVVPPFILWSVSEEIRAIGRVLAGLASGRQIRDAMREARIFGYPHQRLIERHVKRFAPAKIEAALVHAAGIDRMIKGLIPGDVWDELLQLGLRFALVRAS